MKINFVAIQPKPRLTFGGLKPGDTYRLVGSNGAPESGVMLKIIPVKRAEGSYWNCVELGNHTMYSVSSSRPVQLLDVEVTVSEKL